MSLAKRIRDWRYAKGWGPDELAGRAEISRTALYQIECGKTETPRAATLSRIARALGVGIETLLTTDPSRFRDRLSVVPVPGEDFVNLLAVSHELSDLSKSDPVTNEGVSRSGRSSIGSVSPRAHDLERKLLDVLDSPLGESVACIVEESYRLLPVDRQRVVV